MIRWGDYRTGHGDIDRYAEENNLLTDDAHVMGKGKRGAWIKLIQDRYFVGCSQILQFPLSNFANMAVNAEINGMRLYFSTPEGMGQYDPYYVLQIIEEIMGVSLFTKKGKVHKRVTPARIRKAEKVLDKWTVEIYNRAPLRIYSEESDVDYVLAPYLEE